MIAEEQATVRTHLNSSLKPIRLGWKWNSNCTVGSSGIEKKIERKEILSKALSKWNK